MNENEKQKLENPLPYSRAPQILTALKDYGPLSVRGLRQVITPSMSLRAVQKALQRLHENGLIQKRYEHLWRHSAVFHQLGQKDFQLKKVADFLHCDMNALRQPEYRYRELIHTEACGIWQNYLKHQFPTAHVLRDFEIAGDEAAQHALLSRKTDIEVKPDLLLKMPKPDGKGFAMIGIEIEKTRKSDARLFVKLRKYAARTHLDGVLYVCDPGGLTETLRCIYKKSVLMNAIRIKHYAENFFVFTDGLPPAVDTPVKVHNSSVDPLGLRDWIHFLSSTSDTTRKTASEDLIRSRERDS